MATVSRGTNFPTRVVEEMFSKVKGKSTLAKLADAMPVAFNGNSVFVFSMDDEVNVVGENEAKSAGASTAAPVKIIPVKVEYGARFSDEFMYASEEERLNTITAFADGFAKKLARAIDIIGMHGMNPRTASTYTGADHYIDQAAPTQAIGADTIDEAIEKAVALLGDADITGIALSKTAASALAKLTTTDGGKLYPELAWGGQPRAINGVDADINSTVNFGSSTDLAIIGDFSVVKWGYAKVIPLEVIEYGDPDNSGKDLKGYNQVYLRGEAYIGVAVLDPSALAIVTE